MRASLAAVEHDFRHPPLQMTELALEECFRAGADARDLVPMRNPQREPKVTDSERHRAVPAAFLIPLVLYGDRIAILLTKRDAAISYPGHLCFPGGRADPNDRDVAHTALREAQEEIALDPVSVHLIGRLGDYVAHSGYRIAPVVGLLRPPLELRPRAGEVEEILEIPLDHALDSRSYELHVSPADESRAYFVLEHGAAIVTGPTVSILMGLYEALLPGAPRPLRARL